ncbi:DNA ligase-like domain-containing protein [Streptomyces massasporeus]|uniref:hypothetical protein n=1 Tax=Streptomyces massasporeus TaxID=67324 RepID=UPI003655E7F5
MEESETRRLALLPTHASQNEDLLSSGMPLADVFTLHGQRSASPDPADERAFFLDVLAEYQWARDAAGLMPGTIDKLVKPVIELCDHYTAERHPPFAAATPDDLEPHATGRSRVFGPPEFANPFTFAFDLVHVGSTDLTGCAYRRRRAAFETLFAEHGLAAPLTLCRRPPTRPSRRNPVVAAQWLAWTAAGLEGLMWPGFAADRSTKPFSRRRPPRAKNRHPLGTVSVLDMGLSGQQHGCEAGRLGLWRVSEGKSAVAAARDWGD